MIKPIINDFPSEFQTTVTSAFMGAFDAEISELSEVFAELVEKSIDTAEGALLDLMGSAVGLSRAKATQMAMYVIPELQDESYRKLIKIKALQMTSRSTAEQINECLKIWNQAAEIISMGKGSITAATDSNREMVPVAGGVEFNYNYCPAPVNSLDGDTLLIENSGGLGRYYDIYLNTEVKVQTMSPITSLDLTEWELTAGYYAISVQSYAPGYQASKFSNTVIYKVGQKLTAPVISISGKYCSWSAVSHASGYRVQANTFLMETQSTSVDLYAWLSQYAEIGDEFTISVVAIGEDLYNDSDASNEEGYILNDALPAPTVTRAANILLITDTFEDVEQYDIYVDGNLEDTINA